MAVNHAILALQATYFADGLQAGHSYRPADERSATLIAGEAAANFRRTTAAFLVQVYGTDPAEAERLTDLAMRAPWADQ